MNFRLETWPHIGEAVDRLFVRVRKGGYIEVDVRPACPRCRKMRHPHVTRTAWRSMLSEPRWTARHCNRCRVRWTAAEDQRMFTACFGYDAALRLVDRLLGRGYP